MRTFVLAMVFFLNLLETAPLPAFASQLKAMPFYLTARYALQQNPAPPEKNKYIINPMYREIKFEHICR